jgi:hypothetical protein
MMFFTAGAPTPAELLSAIRAFLKENDLMAYLSMMAVRLSHPKAPSALGTFNQR